MYLVAPCWSSAPNSLGHHFSLTGLVPAIALPEKANARTTDAAIDFILKYMRSLPAVYGCWGRDGNGPMRFTPASNPLSRLGLLLRYAAFMLQCICQDRIFRHVMARGRPGLPRPARICKNQRTFCLE